MKRTTLADGVFAALLTAHPAVQAEGLSVEQYIVLSIARLELAKQSWTATQRPPTVEAVAAFFAEYGIEETDYLAFTGANREAIGAYLAAHPDAQARIDALSAEIDQAIPE